MLKAYSKFLDIIEFICRKIIGILMAIMVVVMCYQVVLRYVFNSSNIWSEEITRYMFVYVVLLGSFVAVRRSSHLQVDFLINHLKGNVRKYFTIITTLVVLAFLIYLLPLSYNVAMGTMNSVSPGLNLPMGYVYLAIPIGTVFMILGIIEVLLKKITNTEEEEK